MKDKIEFMMDKIELILGDITKLEVDAVVNAANTSLMGGGGVDGAIHKAAGPELLEQCKVIVKKQGGCPTGEAVITKAGNMPSKFVIHTVGPVYNGGRYGEEDLLADCYRNSLSLAEDCYIKTIAFPNISTGAYRFPKDKAAEIAVREAVAYLEKSEYVQKIIFCCFEKDSFEIYKKALGKTD